MAKNNKPKDLSKKNIEEIYKKLGLSTKSKREKLQKLGKSEEEAQEQGGSTWIVSDSSSKFIRYKL